MSGLKAPMRNRNKRILNMDERHSDENSHSIATEYRDDNALTNETLIQFCKGLFMCLSLNNYFFLGIKILEIGMVPLF